MPCLKVKNYILRYDIDRKQPWINIEYIEGRIRKNFNLFPPKEDAVYIADMLRNEKPVFVYVDDTGNKKWLTTSPEPVGEEES